MNPPNDPKKSYGSRRLARWMRWQDRDRLGVEHPPKKLGKRARRAERQQEALERAKK